MISGTRAGIIILFGVFVQYLMFGVSGRYYLADGVRFCAQSTWLEVFRDLGRDNENIRCFCIIMFGVSGRYYLADGVRFCAQSTWLEVFRDQGRIRIIFGVSVL
jgi:hypothetical protein